MKMGFTEKEIGHMSFYKWKRLYRHYQKDYNFITKKGTYTITDEAKEEANNIVYF
jgi:hypothetical protein